MRHFYFRLILGIVFVACMIFSFVTMNIPFAILYLVLGGAFLFSAYCTVYSLPDFHIFYWRCHVADVDREAAYRGYAGNVYASL